MNRLLLVFIGVSLLFSCEKNDDPNRFYFPQKLYFSSIEQGAIETFVITNIVDSSYIQIPQNDNLANYFLELYKDTFHEYKYESINFDAFNVIMEIDDPLSGIRFEDYFCHNVGNATWEIFYDNSYSLELHIVPPKTVTIPLYMSLFLKNGVGGIPISLKAFPVYKAKPTIDELIKSSIKAHSLQVNDTVYLNRINYVFKSN